MKKEDLSKDLKDTINLIKTNSKDAKFAGELIDKLLSIKGQMDVKPVRLCVEEKDVLKEYDFGSYRFVRCKSGILFQTKGGMSTFVTPRLTALYKHLNNILGLKDDFNDLSKELKDSYDMLLSATVYIMELPLFASVDDEFFFGVASDIISRLDTMVKKIDSNELKDETHDENAMFENFNDAMDNLTK